MSRANFDIEYKGHIIHFEISDLSSTMNMVFEIDNVKDAIDFVEKEKGKQ